MEALIIYIGFSYIVIIGIMFSEESLPAWMKFLTPISFPLILGVIIGHYTDKIFK